MSDEIKVPVSAPGATQAATDIDKATQAARNLLAQKIAARKGVEDFNKAIEAEAKALNKTSPALAKAREEMRAYQQLMRAGHTATAQRVLSSGTLGGGGDRERERLFGRGGFITHLTHGASRVGGEGGELLHRLSSVAGSAGLALGGVTLAAVAVHMAFQRFSEYNERMMASAEEEQKTRTDLNRVLRESRIAQQDSAKNTFNSVRGAQRFIIAGSQDMHQAQGRLNRIDALGDPALYGAVEQFLKTKQGHRLGFTGGLDAADKLFASGAYTYSGALEALGQSKGVINDERIGRLAAKGLGYKRDEGVYVGATEDMKVSEHARLMNTQYDRVTGAGKADELGVAAGASGLNQARNFRDMVLPSLERDLKKAVDPAAVALDEFKRKLDESLEPLQARADAENQILAAYKDSPFWNALFGTESEQTKVSRKRQNQANGTR